MYPVSKEYAAEMRSDIREMTMHATVYFGLFDTTAQMDASAVGSATVPYGNTVNTISGIGITQSYATFETSGFRLDGKTNLHPANLSAYDAQGFISQPLSDGNGVFSALPYILISFKKYHSMVGVTLIFDENFPLPKELTITAYRGAAVYKQQSVTDIMSSHYVVQMTMEDINAIRIEFNQTADGMQRARLNSVWFGAGYTYSDEDLIETNETHRGSPISLILPVSHFNFSLFNEDDKFSVDGDGDIQRFLMEGQQARVDYAVDLPNSVQEIPGGNWFLKEWEINGYIAKFKFEDAIERLTTTTYSKGVYDGQNRTLYELAEMVFADADLTSSEYYIDPYLQRISTRSPVPIVAHAEALQLIANAGTAKLFVDRSGRICLQTVVEDVPNVSSETTQTFYSNASTVGLAGNDSYFTFEPMFGRLDGSQLLLPDSGSTLNAGWVASDVSHDGQYPENSILLVYEAPTNVFSLHIDWDGAMPESFGISPMIDGVYGEEEIYYPTSQRETYSVSFQHVSEIKIRLISSKNDGVRPRIMKITASMLSDFTLEKDQIFGDPISKMGAKLRNVITQWISRTTNNTVTEIINQEVETNSGWVQINHALVMNPTVSIERDGQPVSGVTVSKLHYAYCSFINLVSNVSEKVNVIIKGQEVSEAIYEVVSSAAPTGTDQVIVNPLFDRASTAQNVADWVKDYYTQRVTYNDTIRGFPELEYGDTIYLDNKQPATITNLSLTYDGAFREELELRR